MKRILVRSVHEAFEYVMAHYYPFGQAEFAEKTDTYAVISIQDSHTGGFGFCFQENQYCKGVLTLQFDDIVKEVEGAVLFTKEQAEAILDFVELHRDADTLLIHCYAGQSRSKAVGAFLIKMFGKDNNRYFETGSPNMHVYQTMEKAWLQKLLAGKRNDK
jgi:predicted protein tyrosine phosphatase